MGVLHDEFTKVIKSIWTDPSVLRELLRSILKKRGCSLSDEQLELLAQATESGADSVELPDDIGVRSIEIGPEDIDEAILAFEAKLVSKVEDSTLRVVEQLAPGILKTLYHSLPNALKEWQAVQRTFEKKLSRRWKAGLDRLDMLVTMAHEAGEANVEDLRSELADCEDHDEGLLLNILHALHCRACRTAREIVCLLKAGYADGAVARWRSLHELAVTAFFLLEHRRDTPQRFFDHQAVERWRAAQEFQQHCHFLGDDPFSDHEMMEMRLESEAAINQYGDSFKWEYGWAADVLGVARPTFTQIENSLQMSHWRPYFRLACQSVHVGLRSIFFSIGLPDDSEITLLAGASDTGLAEPGHQMALSLTMVTVAFLTARPSLDGLVTCHCLLALCDDIREELSSAHESMGS